MWLIYIEDIRARKKTNDCVLQQCRKNHLLLPEHQGAQAEIFQGHTKERWRSISKNNSAKQNCKQKWKHGFGQQQNRMEISSSNEGMPGLVNHDAKGR